MREQLADNGPIRAKQSTGSIAPESNLTSVDHHTSVSEGVLEFATKIEFQNSDLQKKENQTQTLTR